MIKRLFIALILITFGALLAPNASYACGKNQKKTEKSSHHSKSASQAEKKDICKDDPCKDEHSNKDQGCGSNCNHPNCKCVHLNVTLALTQENLLKDTIVNFSARKYSLTDTENNLSQGFHSIWQPPKIS